MLSFAWYKKLKTQKQVSCDCDDDKNPSFFKSKVFLSLVTLFSILMLAFPSYAWAFYPDTPEPTATLEQSTRPNQSSITKEIFSVQGMTCAGCEQHLENEVKKLDGIIVVKADYEHGKARVSFDATRLSKEQIIKAINSIGYKEKKKMESTRTRNYDVFVIGSGMAGMTAANKCASKA